MEKYNNAFELITGDAKKLNNYKERSDLMDEATDLVSEIGLKSIQLARESGIDLLLITNLRSGGISELSAHNLRIMVGAFKLLIKHRSNKAEQPRDSSILKDV